MPTRDVNLTDRDNDFVERQIASGRFKNASEVIRAGLRLLEQRANEDDAKLAVLRGMAVDGFAASTVARGPCSKASSRSHTSLNRLVGEHPSDAFQDERP